MTFSSKEVEIFKNRLKMMKQEQENKNIWLSNYEEEMKNSVLEFKETVVNIAIDNMILKQSETLENFKKAKMNIEENVMSNSLVHFYTYFRQFNIVFFLYDLSRLMCCFLMML